MKKLPYLLCLVGFTLLAAALTVQAGPLKAELDCTANKGKLLNSHFEPFPQKPQTIFREEGRARFWLPAEFKDSGQSTLYSKFAVAGDFEISMTYDGFEVEQPKVGHGVSVGIAVETENPDGTPGIRVQVARGSYVGRGDSLVVTVGTLKKKPGERGIDYQETHVENAFTKSGKIVLKRVRDKLHCMAGDVAKPIDELYTLVKVPFTDSTIKKLRIYADQGGSPTPLDVHVSDVLIRAEELTFQVPACDRPGWLWWLIAGATFVVAGGIATIVHVKRNHRK